LPQLREGCRPSPCFYPVLFPVPWRFLPILLLSTVRFSAPPTLGEVVSLVLSLVRCRCESYSSYFLRYFSFLPWNFTTVDLTVDRIPARFFSPRAIFLNRLDRDSMKIVLALLRSLLPPGFFPRKAASFSFFIVPLPSSFACDGGPRWLSLHLWVFIPLFLVAIFPLSFQTLLFQSVPLLGSPGVVPNIACSIPLDLPFYPLNPPDRLPAVLFPSFHSSHFNFLVETRSYS